jgi:hypothetical protein
MHPRRKLRGDPGVGKKVQVAAHLPPGLTHVSFCQMGPYEATVRALSQRIGGNRLQRGFYRAVEPLCAQKLGRHPFEGMEPDLTLTLAVDHQPLVVPGWQ